MARRVDDISRILAQGEDEAEIDLTPMLDVVFIMLIFFIVTASFLNEVGVDATRPPSVQTPPTDSKSIAIRIYSSGQIVIDGLTVDPRAVGSHITRRKAENSGTTLAVLVGKGARTELIVGVIDAARDSGFRDSAIPISELEE